MQQRNLILILVVISFQNIYSYNFVGSVHIEKENPITRKSKNKFLPQHLDQLFQENELLICVTLYTNKYCLLDGKVTQLCHSKSSLLVPLSLFLDEDNKFKKSKSVISFNQLKGLYDIDSNDEDSESDQSDQTNIPDYKFQLGDSFKDLESLLKKFIISEAKKIESLKKLKVSEDFEDEEYEEDEEDPLAKSTSSLISPTSQSRSRKYSFESTTPAFRTEDDFWNNKPNQDEQSQTIEAEA